jgi:hypothetical protein
MVTLVAGCLLAAGCTSTQAHRESATPTDQSSKTPGEATEAESDKLATAVVEVLSRDVVVTETTWLVDGQPRRTHTTTWVASTGEFVTDVRFTGVLGDPGHVRVLYVGGQHYVMGNVRGLAGGCWVTMPEYFLPDVARLTGRPLDAFAGLEPDAVRLPGGMRFLSDPEFDLYIDGPTGDETLPAEILFQGDALAGFEFSGEDLFQRLQNSSLVPDQYKAGLRPSRWIVSLPIGVQPTLPRKPAPDQVVSHDRARSGESCRHPSGELAASA